MVYGNCAPSHKVIESKICHACASLEPGLVSSVCSFWQEAVVATPLQAALAAVKNDASMETMNQLVQTACKPRGRTSFER